MLGDTKNPLLCCIPFISKFKKNGDMISTGQYMNYQFLTIYNLKN